MNIYVTKINIYTVQRLAGVWFAVNMEGLQAHQAGWNVVQQAPGLLEEPGHPSAWTGSPYNDLVYLKLLLRARGNQTNQCVVASAVVVYGSGVQCVCA